MFHNQDAWRETELCNLRSLFRLTGDRYLIIAGLGLPFKRGMATWAGRQRVTVPWPAAAPAPRWPVLRRRPDAWVALAAAMKLQMEGRAEIEREGWGGEGG